MKYNIANCWIIIIFYTLINFFIFIKNKKAICENYTSFSSIFQNVLISEIIFSTAFIFWTYVRCFSPQITYTTEKFMNFGFLNSLFNTIYLPAQDMWLAGNQINYYYFGQYIFSFLIKTSLLNIEEGFNLSVATINTFSLVLPLLIGYTLGQNALISCKNKIKKFIPAIIAILCGLSVSIGGTLYYPIYNFIVDRETPYYYWEDTRYIGYRPDTNDQTINEILPYSNIVGDLHAHHIDTLFVFFNLALLLNLLLDNSKKTLKASLISPNIFLIGITLGIYKMANFWDFPIYLTIAIITIIFNNFRKLELNKKISIMSLIQIIEIICISFIISLPFTLDFHMSATQICLSYMSSPLYKMFVLWGLPTLCVIIHVLSLIITYIKTQKDENYIKHLHDYSHKLTISDIFIFILGCCAIGLIIIPEIIYVKDIYTEPFKRANTVYKLCYQAELLFDISASYILIKLLVAKHTIVKKIISITLLSTFISTFGYGINAISYVTNNFNSKTYSLNSIEIELEKNHPLEYNALQWIKNNIEKDKIILEKPSGSYNLSSYISVFAGNPTILGWHGHEWIWRAEKDYSAPAIVTERWNDANTIYSSTSIPSLKNIIKKYNISYIYVDTSKTSNLSTLKQLGTIVYEVTDKTNSIHIIKVN